MHIDGSSNHDRQYGELHRARDFKGSSLEGAKLAILGSGALRRDVKADPVSFHLSGCTPERFIREFAIAAIELDESSCKHGVAPNGRLEQFFFRGHTHRERKCVK